MSIIKHVVLLAKIQNVLDDCDSLELTVCPIKPVALDYLNLSMVTVSLENS